MEELLLELLEEELFGDMVCDADSDLLIELDLDLEPETASRSWTDRLFWTGRT